MTTKAAPAERTLRADAAKNRARILAAAEEVFASEGVAVPVDLVAERAGLGVGTLYRHFPTKEALFEAIVVSRLEELVTVVEREPGGAEPGEALFAFLRQLSHQAATKRDLIDALGSAGIDIKSRCAVLIDDIKRHLEQMRRRAVAAGAVRGDVSTEEMMGLVVGTCQAAGHAGADDVNLRRMMEVVFDGLRAPAPSN